MTNCFVPAALAGLVLAGALAAQQPTAGQPGGGSAPPGQQSAPGGAAGAPGSVSGAGGFGGSQPGAGTGGTPLFGGGGKTKAKSGQSPSMMPGGGMPGMSFGGSAGGFTREKEVKSMTLEELLAKALKDNPDIRVAESKVHEAEAELNRARLLVLQKVAKVKQEIALARQIMESEVRQLERVKALNSSRAISQEEALKAELAVERARAEVAKLEAELPYLVGRQPATASGSGLTMSVPMMGPGAGGMGSGTTGGGFGTGFGSSPMTAFEFGAARSVPGTLSEKIHQALETPIKGEFRDSHPREIIDWISKYFKGVNVHVQVKIPENAKATIKLDEAVPVGAALQWLEDEFGWRCVLRDYGVVITDRDRVPPAGTSLLDNWRKARVTEPKK